MEYSIMIVEDEEILREIVKDYLMSEGYLVLEAKNGKEALNIFNNNPNKIDLVILDIMLPEVDGWTVCKRIRKESDIPIIMLTARVDEDDTLLGFTLGADDYVTKPYSPPILLARSKRLLESRAKKSGLKNQASPVQGIDVDFLSRIVKVEMVDIKLTFTEFEILTYLMENKGIVITREQLIVKIWGYEFNGDDRTINTHIRNLRYKLGKKSRHIITVVRTGYKFDD